MNRYFQWRITPLCICYNNCNLVTVVHGCWLGNTYVGQAGFSNRCTNPISRFELLLFYLRFLYPTTVSLTKSKWPFHSRRYTSCVVCAAQTHPMPSSSISGTTRYKLNGLCLQSAYVAVAPSH